MIYLWAKNIGYKMNNTVERALQNKLRTKIKSGKVTIILGARRVGKTELLKTYLSKVSPNEYIYLNGDDQRTIDLLSNRSIENYKRLVGNAHTLVIDEAQRVPDIGLKLKLMIDELKNLKIIVTGSSVFDLSNKLGEPLVGRENTWMMYPIAQCEYSKKENYIQTIDKREERLIFGSYPELLQYKSWEEKAEYLESIVNSYLLRDILEFDGIKKADKIFDLLRLLAFQIGKEVSMDELASNLKGISRNTIERYLDLLSKVFIIYPLKGFSRNLRKEIVKSHRWYFYDNGIRNAIIRNYNPLQLRMDKGELWENYLMSERIKWNSYRQYRVNSYFWRTYDQQEIDLIEETSGSLNAYEFKWQLPKKENPPAAWKNNYPDSTYKIIHTDNYLDFISNSV